ncbi:nucleoside diphosphate-linked moiety X motif 8-like [Bombyx mandarina]|uniref:Nudix hydrolase domain-containing protein n=2 Tax=Bombyx TaxID=7090 RepID=A0A8R2C545_BOMMO|nr:nucleoside diphosphate-linked moiety X motif 8-like [Bombyx mori]XP_028029225.1 nucleoside diphosphate-linked moiety X motif 8-like [Bombyx mandarina]
MCAKSPFSVNSIFCLTSRERCLMNLKRAKVPKFGSTPTATAAVLVPLCRVAEVPSLLYTVRSSNLRTNSGQISFPGGKTDKNETPIETALRETDEEIGLSAKEIDVWGHGPAVPGRNNKIMITPVIGTIFNFKPESLNINVKEVAEVFTVPIEMLCDTKNQHYTQFKNGFILPVFLAGGYKIWGITAYLTHMFLSSLMTKDVYRNEWMKKKIKL